MTIASQKDRDELRLSGKKLARALAAVERLVRPGIGTKELDDEARRVIVAEGAQPSFLGYKGYPAALCVSINDEIVHGIPSKKKKLHEGDIAGLDLGLIWNGYFVDMAVTVAVGKVSQQAEKLIRVSREALAHGIDFLQAGKTTGDLGHHIEEFVVDKGFVVIRDLVGHGVGKAIHEEPSVPNFGEKGHGLSFDEDMVVAIEPMVSESTAHTKTDRDGWTIRTDDGSLAAHFEHTVIVGKKGTEIITKE